MFSDACTNIQRTLPIMPNYAPVELVTVNWFLDFTPLNHAGSPQDERVVVVVVVVVAAAAAAAAAAAIVVAECPYSIDGYMHTQRAQYCLACVGYNSTREQFLRRNCVHASFHRG